MGATVFTEGGTKMTEEHYPAYYRNLLKEPTLQCDEIECQVLMAQAAWRLDGEKDDYRIPMLQLVKESRLNDLGESCDSWHCVMEFVNVLNIHERGCCATVCPAYYQNLLENPTFQSDHVANQVLTAQQAWRLFAEKDDYRIPMLQQVKETKLDDRGEPCDSWHCVLQFVNVLNDHERRYATL
jgi:hypothetical protein